MARPGHPGIAAALPLEWAGPDAPHDLGEFDVTRPLARLAALIVASAAGLGCDSAMTDVSLKPEVTGDGPREPEGPGKNPGSGNVDLGEVRRGGPLETKAQGGPIGAPMPEPEAKPKAEGAAKPEPKGTAQ